MVNKIDKTTQIDNVARLIIPLYKNKIKARKVVISIDTANHIERFPLPDFFSCEKYPERVIIKKINNKIAGANISNCEDS